MKFTTLVLLVCTLHISAKSVSQTINIQVHESSITHVLHEARKQSGFNFIYNDKILENLDQVSMVGTDMNINGFLSELLQGTGITYKITGKNIFLTPIEDEGLDLLEVFQKERSGVIKDANGHPIPGVTVKNAQTGLQTTTTADGAFTLRARQGDILIFTSIGYEELQLPITTQTFLPVELVADVNELDEVVVVGYGTQRRRDVTGAINSIPQERLEMAPHVNIAQVLQGAVPGMIVQQSEGGSNPQSSIMIRGRNSILASNDPLIILDGIPYGGNLSDINVNDISNIEVLKDASAAAIYGSRGANGVILITSKTGTGTGKTRVAYDGKYSIQTANNMPRFMTPEEFYEFKELREPGNMTPTEQDHYDQKTWTNWADEALRNGQAFHNNLSLNGGLGQTQYYISAGTLGVTGQTLNDQFDRLNGRMAVQSRLFDHLTIGTTLQLISADYGDAPVNWTDILRINPLTSAFDSDGSPLMYPWPEFIDISNPLDPLKYDYERKSFQLMSNNFLQLDIPYIDGLSYRLNVGYHQQTHQMSNFRGRDTGAGFSQQGYFTSEDRNNSYLSLEHIASYKKQIGKHYLDLTGVYGFESSKMTLSTLEASHFPHDFITKYAIAQANFKLPGYDFYETALIGQMLRLNYSYDGRYLLTLTGRRDGYSGFGANKKWGTFPSVALGWNLAEENFGLKDHFQEFKLRASYGLNGNQAVNAYETISRLGEQNMVTGSQPLPGYVPIKLGQDELGWESSRTLNMGVDMQFWNNRISTNLNIYNTDTYDLLLNRTISPVHGISNITQNIGKTNNRGLEIALTAHILNDSDLRWTSQGNLAVNKNKIVALYGLLDEFGNEIDDYANHWFIGQPISANFDQKFMGVWQSHEENEAAAYGYKPGDAKILDANADGKITPDDRVFLGQRDPSLTWGWTNTFRYKQWGLSIFVHGIHGVTKLNELLQDASSSSGVRRNVIKKDWWTPENPTNAFFANSILTHTAPLYQDASFIRLKDISLSYDLEESIATRIGADRLRIYFNVRNAHTWSRWTTHDPELRFGRGAAPHAKEFVLGLTINL